MTSFSTARDPIFILGISPRSGTNFLFDLLLLHPDCGAPSRNWEDLLVEQSNFLSEYVSAVYSKWKPRGVAAEVEDRLYQGLGNGLLSVLVSLTGDKRLVTKTPSVRNLHNFFRLFPQAYLVVVVRDGRAVTESRVQTFSETYEEAMRSWAAGADAILQFRETAERAGSRYLIVRYEDLWDHLQPELERVFTFLELDPAKFDFDAAASLPIRGSSVFHGTDQKDVHWKPIEKTAAFDPLSRWKHWGKAVHERFNWIAGQQQIEFGYDAKRPDTAGVTWLMWNKLMDAKRRFLLWGKATVKRILGAETASKARRILSFGGKAH